MVQTDRYFEYRSRQATGGWDRSRDVPPFPFGHPDLGDDITWPAHRDEIGTVARIKDTHEPHHGTLPRGKFAIDYGDGAYCVRSEDLIFECPVEGVHFVVGEAETRDWPDECPVCCADEHADD